MMNQKCVAINKEKTVSILNGMLTVKLLSLSIGRNRGEVTEIVIFAAIGDGLQVFRISTVGDADTGDLTLLCHIYCLLFFHNGVIGKLIPGDSATIFHKTDDLLCGGICLGNLIQCILDEIMIFHFILPLSGVVFTCVKDGIQQRNL